MTFGDFNHQIHEGDGDCSEEDENTGKRMKPKTYTRTFLLAVRSQMQLTVQRDFRQELLLPLQAAETPEKRLLLQSRLQEVAQLFAGRYPEKALTIRRPDPQLNKSTNPWKPSKTTSKDDLDGLTKDARGILNKLTPTMFPQLLQDFLRLGGGNWDEMRCSAVVRVLFDKAVQEPHFCRLYALLCHAVVTRPTATGRFRRALLNRCQHLFQQTNQSPAVLQLLGQMGTEEMAEKRAQLQAQLEEVQAKEKRRLLGNIRLIGELFHLGWLPITIIRSCIHQLLTPDTESLESLCQLLSVVGSGLEERLLNDVFHQLTVFQTRVPPRIRFMIQDILDLRQAQWRRKTDCGPKTLHQIKLEQAQHLAAEHKLSRARQGLPPLFQLARQLAEQRSPHPLPLLCQTANGSGASSDLSR